MTKIKQAQKTQRATKAAAPEAGQWWKDRNTILLLLSVLLVTFIVMSPSLKNDFVAWDDDINIYENQNIRSLDVESIRKIFSAHIIGGYNPLTILSFALEYQFFKLNPFPYHLNNILLHLANTLLVFWLMLLLGLRRPWALLAALLFGIHPMRVESVAWVTERKDLLFAIFYLGALISYINYLRHKKARYVVQVYVLFILSLLSKIQAVSLPLSMLLVDYLLKRPINVKLLIEKVPHFALSLATGLLGIYFLRQQGSLEGVDYSFMEKILVGFYSLVTYISKAVVPFEMSAIYPFPKPGDFPAVDYISPFIIAGLAYLVWLSVRSNRWVAFGALFFFVNVVFVLQVVSAGQGFITDRFTYVPYIGLFFLVASGLQWFLERNRSMAVYTVMGLVLYLGVLAVLSYNQCKVWRNTATLFTNVLKKHSKVAVAYNNRGRYYRENKMFDKAIADYTQLLALKPEDHATFVGRGRLYFDMGNYDKAMTDFNKAIELNKGSAMAFSNRGAIYGMRKQYDLALTDLDRALELDPKLEDAILNRSLAYFETRQYDKSVADCKAYLELVPDDPDTYNMMAVAKAAMGQFESAEADYNAAIRLNPKNGIFYQNRSYLYDQMGDKSRALRDARTAMQMGVKLDQGYLDRLGQ
jgi:tetratricopeptide (TPR) repeat protein